MEQQVKIIPVEQPFLKILARYFLAQFSNKLPDFSNIMVVLPNERNKFYFRRYLLEDIANKGFIPPTMFTIDDMKNYVFEKLGGERSKLLNNLERNFILKTTVDNLRIELWQDLPFLKFIAIGERLLNFFDELAQARITLDEIEQQSTELHFPEKYVQNEIPILKRVYQEYRNNMSALGYFDNIDRLEIIHNKFNSDIFTDFECVLIAGIAGTNQIERVMIKKILNNLTAMLFLHSGSPEEILQSKDPDQRFYIHYKLLEHLAVDIKKVEVLKNGTIPEPVIHITRHETISRQTFYLSEIVREALKKYQEPHRIGIIITDNSLLFPITETLKSASIEYNLSAGFPFTNQIFYSFLKQLYEVIKSEFHYLELFTFINHPLVKNAVVNGVPLKNLVYEMKNNMIQNRLNYFIIDKQDLQRKLPGLDTTIKPLTDFLEHCFGVVQAQMHFGAYVENLITLLNNVLSDNQELIKSNFPGIGEFLEHMHNLVNLRIPEKASEPGVDMLELILRILENGQYHLEGEPFKGIQIIGVLETRNLDFDCVIMPSMNEGIFPRKSEKDMFINQALRKNIGLLTCQERDNLYYYYFTELVSGKKEVYLSYVNEEKKDIPSRFIARLKTSGIPEKESPVRFHRTAIEFKPRQVSKDKLVYKKLEDYVKRNGLSHSSLTAYRKCPYRFYLTYILKIQEPEMISEEADAQIWGGIVHQTLRDFYTTHFPDGIKRDVLKETTRKIEELFEKAIKHSKNLAVKPKPIIQIEKLYYKKALIKFLSTEVARFEEGFKIDVKSLEEKIDYEVTVGNSRIKLKGYIDRVDVFDGRYYIIDYKTGKPPDRQEYLIGEDFTEFQLPLYGMIFAQGNLEKIGGLAYYYINIECEFDRICQDEEARQYLSEFYDKILVPTIQEMLDPAVSFYQTQDEEKCKYCSFKQLCGRLKYGTY